MGNLGIEERYQAGNHKLVTNSNGMYGEDMYLRPMLTNTIIMGELEPQRGGNDELNCDWISDPLRRSCKGEGGFSDYHVCVG